MDTNICYKNDLVDSKANLSKPHLSFVINFLLPKHLVDKQRIKRQFDSFQTLCLKDKSLSDECFRPLLVGSVAEGYNIPDTLSRTNSFMSVLQTNADGDILFENTVLSVLAHVEDVDSQPDDIKKCLLECTGSHPCYGRVRLRDEPRKMDDVFIIAPNENIYYLSGTKIQAKLFSTMISVGESLELHGPALSTFSSTKTESELLQRETNDQPQIHAQDYVYALPCIGWPIIAKPWIERQEKGNWIDSQIVKEIIKEGIHVVPAPHRLSEHPELEWRLSFATTEVYLAQNVITDEQRQCYIFLKIIHSQVIKKLEILTSYHLKTVFLYSCEMLPAHAWIENIGACFLFMVDLLIECCQKKVLPNFFIPENNMIDYFTSDQIFKVLEVLELVRKRPLEPVLQFTDKNVIGLQSLSTPFSEIVQKVFEDSSKFLIHGDIQKTAKDAFVPALFKMVLVLALEQKPEEAVRYVINIFPIIDKYCPGRCNVAQIIDTIGMTFIQDVKLSISLLEEVLKYKDQYPDVLLLRGNLACLFHVLAYSKPTDSDEQMIALAQSETLFNSVVENTYSPSVVDFSCLLINKGCFKEAAEKLGEFIDLELKQSSGSQHTFYKKEAAVLDEKLQKEIEVHETFSVNSLSMAYYLLINCALKNDLWTEEKSFFNVLQNFTDHCENLNESSSYILLGYILMYVNNYESAHNIFQKALRICSGSTLLIEKNLASCK